MTIKNGDLPAMPLSGDAYSNFAVAVCDTNVSYDPECQGLTKREYFAAMAMQGVTSLPKFDSDPETIEMAAKWAVNCADALLSELSK